MSLVSILKDRAQMLQAARAFFAARGVLEVDCSALVPAAAIDLHIDLISAEIAPGQTAYLHTSPEYAMKRLLSEGSGDIYYLGHVFRYGEQGRRHRPEFTMAEWYRIGFSLTDLIQETVQFMELFLGPQPLEILSYREAFRRYAGTEPAPQEWDRDTQLHYIMSHRIEPQLGQNGLTAIAYYPPEQAALARIITHEGEPAAERFEIYYKGVELCNGYHELVDPIEQERRFITDNQLRQEKGKETYPHDERFLEALRRGLPDCSGVAVGFDRLMLLRHGGLPISDVVC